MSGETEVDAGLDWARKQLGCPASNWRVDFATEAYWAFSPTHAVDGLVIVGRDAQELVARVRVQVRMIAVVAGVNGRLPPGGVLCGITLVDPPPAPVEVRPGVFQVKPLPELPEFATGGTVPYVDRSMVVRIPTGNPPPPGTPPPLPADAYRPPQVVHTLVVPAAAIAQAAQAAQAAGRPARRGPVAIQPTVRTVPRGMGGYLGDPCPECGQFLLVQNGSCAKCTGCGTTTGCS